MTSTSADNGRMSVTPRPSPDGRQLAFVRRVRLGSELFVKDLETGSVTLVSTAADGTKANGRSVGAARRLGLHRG